jgi:hypothetical protein
MKALGLLLAAAVAVPALAGDLPYAEPARVSKITRSMTAFKGPGAKEAENLSHYLSSLARGACRSDDDALLAACLVEQAKRNCASLSGGARNRCPALSDVIVTNVVNEKQFVSREERFALLQKSGATSFDAAYGKIVLRKYALIATEYLLTQPDCPVSSKNTCLARSIDEYCLKHADIRNLPWQGCVSSIIWFLGTSS